MGEADLAAAAAGEKASLARDEWVIAARTGVTAALSGNGATNAPAVPTAPLIEVMIPIIKVVAKPRTGGVRAHFGMGVTF